MGMPAGASSNMPIGACPLLTIISLITMLVEVLMSDTELVRIEAKASGSSSRDGLVPLRAAMPSTTGMKKAVAAVLLMKADSSETETITTATSNERAVSGARQDPLADGIDDAGVGQGRRHDEQAEDHHHRAAAEAGKCLFRRNEARADDRQQHAERHHIRRNAIP